MAEETTRDEVTTGSLTQSEGITGVSNSLFITRLQSVTRNLNWYLGVIILVIGIFGNLLSIMVFRRPLMRRLPLSNFLTYLAVTDLLLVVFGHGISSFPDYTVNFDVFSLTPWACKLWYLVIPSLRTLSSLIVSGLSVERCVAIKSPLKLLTHQAWGRWGALIFVGSVFMAALIYNIHAFFVFDLQDDFRDGHLVHRCNPIHGTNLVFVAYIRPVVSVVINCLLPFAVILICNILIAVELRRSTALIGPFQGQSYGRDTRSVLITQLVVSFVFVLLNIPINTAMILTRIYPAGYWWSTPKLAASSEFLWSFALNTLYLNSAINFFLYVVSGNAYRRELALTLCGPFRCHSSKYLDKETSEFKSTTGKSRITGNTEESC